MHTDQFKPLLKGAKEHHNIFRQYCDKLEQFAKLSIPIYKGGGFQGLITEDGIAKWLSQNIISDHSVTISIFYITKTKKDKLRYY